MLRDWVVKRRRVCRGGMPVGRSLHGGDGEEYEEEGTEVIS
jgi:hypothetical protein